MSQLNGTAVPSLALECLQEVENQNLNESDRNKAEDIIAGVLASMYSGQYLPHRINLIEIVLQKLDLIR
jgi:hypothetical protein